MERREALKKTLVALGYTISIPSLIGIFESCNSNTSQTWQPEVFSTNQASTMAELAETILPKTKTPGAKDLNLDKFIDRMIKQVLSKDDQQAFLKGMDAFDAKSKELNGKNFIDSSAEQRTKYMGVRYAEGCSTCSFLQKGKRANSARIFYIERNWKRSVDI